jgi:type I restriction enzyme S subunit
MELPEGWKLVKLGDIAKINPKKSEVKKLLSKNIEVSFVPMNAVDEFKGEINNYQIKRINEVYKGYTYFKEEDIIFAKITPCMENGKCAIASNLKNNISFGSTEFHVIRVNEGIYNKWVWHILRFSKTRNEATKHFMGAVGHKRVPADFLKNLLIPIPYKDGKPDLQKQKEIVNKIETLFNNINKAIELRQKAINETKDLFNSVLNKIFKDEEFKLVKVEDALNNKAKFKIGKLKSSDYLKEGACPIIDQGQKFIAGYHNDESLLYGGQLPIIALGDHTLNIKYIDFRFIQGADGLKILIPNKNIVYEKYLYYSLEFFKPKVKKYSRHYKIIKNLLIPIPYKDGKPDLQKQKEIAEYLENIHNKIKKLEELQEKQLNLFKELKESILNKAFKGELV